MNGATCNEVRDGYECICPTGFKGTDCEGMLVFQPHLAQCYSRRIALISCGAHESEIYFEVQLGLN